MTLLQLVYFKEVAETLHFTKAAQKLFITQSALSYAITSLEKELDVPLFVREKGKNISLTSFGQALLPKANEAIEKFEEIEETMRQMRNPHSGVVNVIYSYINGYRFIPKMFSSFMELPQFADISINFEINYKRYHFEDDVAGGKIDLAFSCTPATEGLEVVPFAKQKLYAYIPLNHPLANKKSVTVAELADQLLIAHDQGRNLDKRVLGLFGQYGFKPNITVYTEDWMESFSYASLGRGIAIMPKLPYDDELLRCVPINDPLATRDIYMMWASNRKLPPAVEYVRDCCLHYFDKPPVV